jgi:urea transport system ATP-binding protein
MPTTTPLLEIDDVSVVFDGFKALSNLSFNINQGEVRFLIGPNGAGKTTCVDVITSLTKPTSGEVRFQGEKLTGKNEFDVVKLGIGRTFQNPTVFDDLTVIENVDLAGSFRMKLHQLLRKRKGITPQVAEALALTSLTEFGERPAGELSHGQRQWLEIAMLLAQDPKLLLLDEPVAGMSKPERQSTGEMLHEIAKTRTVLVVEHDMDFLRSFASVVTVMHEGHVLCEGTVAEVQADPTVQEVYLGRGRTAPEDDAVVASAATSTEA